MSMDLDVRLSCEHWIFLKCGVMFGSKGTGRMSGWWSRDSWRQRTTSCHSHLQLQNKENSEKSLLEPGLPASSCFLDFSRRVQEVGSGITMCAEDSRHQPGGVKRNLKAFKKPCLGFLAPWCLWQTRKLTLKLCYPSYLLFLYPHFFFEILF